MVRHTLETLGPKVLASRMVRDYVLQLYLPAAQSSRAFEGPDGAVRARELAEWKARVKAAWSEVSVEHVESYGVGDIPELGGRMTVRAYVRLGSLTPDDVSVDVVHGRVDANDRLLDPPSRRSSGSTRDRARRGGPGAPGPTGLFGYTARSCHVTPGSRYTVACRRRRWDAGRCWRGRVRRVMAVCPYGGWRRCSRACPGPEARERSASSRRRRAARCVTAATGGDARRYGAQRRRSAGSGRSGRTRASTGWQQHRLACGPDGDAVGLGGVEHRFVGLPPRRPRQDERRRVVGRVQQQQERVVVDRVAVRVPATPPAGEVHAEDARGRGVPVVVGELGAVQVDPAQVLGATGNTGLPSKKCRCRKTRWVLA